MFIHGPIISAQSENFKFKGTVVSSNPNEVGAQCSDPVRLFSTHPSNKESKRYSFHEIISVGADAISFKFPFSIFSQKFGVRQIFHSRLQILIK